MRSKPLLVLFSTWVALVGIALGQKTNVTVVRSPNPADRLPPAPILNSCSQAGVSIGGEAVWTVKGQNLKDVKAWLVSGGGVEVVEVKEQTAEKKEPAAKAEPTAKKQAVAKKQAMANNQAADVKLKVKASQAAIPGFRELRALGPGGLSNDLTIRVDSLRQIDETEPNDQLEKAQNLDWPCAVAGSFKPQDLDFYTFTGKQNAKIVLEVEAHRLNSQVSPVVVLLNEEGAIVAQSRETPGTEKDCRVALTLPRTGKYYIQVHDQTYRGGPSLFDYRLRLDEGLFATAMHPLGAPRGSKAAFRLEGGNLDAPIEQTVEMPRLAGSLLEPPPFACEHGQVLAPGLMIVGEGPEVDEADFPAVPGGWLFEPGVTINGTLGKPGELDRYLIPLEKGQAVRLRVVANVLGSWLDSVLTVRNASDAVLAENDDSGVDGNRRGNALAGLAELTSDSKLEFEAPAKGVYAVELSDRYGDGGVEYGYRLTIEPITPDFSIRMTLGQSLNPNQVVINNGKPAPSPTSYSLMPGGRVEVPFAIYPDRFEGAVEVRAEGLPAGVTANAVTVEVKPTPQAQANAKAKAQRRVGNAPVQGSLTLFADPFAEPTVGELRIVGVGKPKAGDAKGEKTLGNAQQPPSFERLATAGIPGSQPRNVIGGIPQVRKRVDHLPLAIVGEPRPKSEGPAREVSIAGVHVPGVLLQGADVQLLIAVDPRKPSRSERFLLEVETESALQLLAQPIVSESLVKTEAFGELGVHGVVQLAAAATSPVGVHPIKIRVIPERSGKPTETTASIIIHSPGRLRVLEADKPIALTRGLGSSIRVMVEREHGIATTVDVRAENLPAGVRMVGKSVISANQTTTEVKLERLASGAPLPAASNVRIVGVARMARGPVELKAVNQPRFVEPGADK